MIKYVFRCKSAAAKAAGIILLASLAACAAPTVKPLPFHKVQVVQSTWYGGSFHGKKTASGEVFDSTAFTAAHSSMPLGSWIKVENPLNNKSLVLKINDRKPRGNSAKLDISLIAADYLDFVDKGKQRLIVYSLPIQNDYKEVKTAAALRYGIERMIIPEEQSEEQSGEEPSENAPFPNDKENPFLKEDKIFSNRFVGLYDVKQPQFAKLNLKKFLKRLSM